MELRGRFTPENFENMISRQRSPKRSTQWAKFLVVFGGPRPLGACVVATPFFRQKWPRKSKMVFVSFENIHIWLSYGHKMARMPIFGHWAMGIRFLDHFWANWADIFYGSSRDPYLSIDDEKSQLRCLFSIFDFLGHFWQGNGRGHHSRPKWSGASKPNQKVGPLGGPFGPTIISKS